MNEWKTLNDIIEWTRLPCSGQTVALALTLCVRVYRSSGAARESFALFFPASRTFSPLEAEWMSTRNVNTDRDRGDVSLSVSVYFCLRLSIWLGDSEAIVLEPWKHKGGWAEWKEGERGQIGCFLPPPPRPPHLSLLPKLPVRGCRGGDVSLFYFICEA